VRPIRTSRRAAANRVLPEQSLRFGRTPVRAGYSRASARCVRDTRTCVSGRRKVGETGNFRRRAGVCTGVIVGRLYAWCFLRVASPRSWDRADERGRGMCVCGLAIRAGGRTAEDGEGRCRLSGPSERLGALRALHVLRGAGRVPRGARRGEPERLVRPVSGEARLGSSPRGLPANSWDNRAMRVVSANRERAACRTVQPACGGC